MKKIFFLTFVFCGMVAGQSYWKLKNSKLEPINPNWVTGGEMRPNALTVGDENIEGQGIYIASHFATGTEKLLISESNDGISWNLISTKSLFTPDSGTLRDPSIMYRSGRYWITYTPKAGIDNNYIAIISSPDLLHWAHVVNVDLSLIAGNPPSVYMRTWAPEWFVDGDSVRIYVSIGQHTGFGYKKIYELHATNSALTAWSLPAKVFEITSPTNQSVIDPFMVKVGTTYYLWFKNDSTNTEYIGYATNDSATGLFTLVKSGDWAGWNPASGTATGLECPSLVKVDSNTWRIYFEQSVGDTIFYSESTDNFSTWTHRTMIKTPVYRMQHPTVLRTMDLGIARNAFSARESKGSIWTSRGNNSAFLWYGGETLDTMDFNNAYINNINGMSVGTTRSSPFAGTNFAYFSSDNNVNFRAVVIEAIRNSSGAYSLQFWKSRGTNTARTQVLSGDRLGTVSAQGWKNASNLSAETGRIDFFADDNYTDTTLGGIITMATIKKGTAVSTERLRITGGGVGIGATSFGTSAVNVLAIASGTAPTSSPADMVQMFVQDSSGTAGTASLFVRSEAGEVTQLSEHAGDAPEWMYDDNDRMAKSYNVYTGIITYTNKDRSERLLQLERLKKSLPKDTLKLITFYQESFTQYNKRTGHNLQVEDWDANQNTIFAERQKELVAWTKLKIEHGKKLEDWKRSKIPLKDRIEAPVFNEPRPKEYVKKQRPRFLRKK